MVSEKTVTFSNIISVPKNKRIAKIEIIGSMNLLQNLKVNGSKVTQIIKAMQIGVYGIMYFG
jgi:hypothetical protein